MTKTTIIFLKVGTFCKRDICPVLFYCCLLNEKEFISSGRGEISVIGLNGSGRKTIVTGISNPHRIVIDPEKDALYWITKGKYFCYSNIIAN